MTYTTAQSVLINSLKGLIERSEADVTEFARKVVADPVYAIGDYAEHLAVSAAKARIADEMLDDLDELDCRGEGYEDKAENLDEVVKHHKTMLTKRLLDDYWKGSSTSAFSNARDAAVRKAASEFLRDYLTRY